MVDRRVHHRLRIVAGPLVRLYDRHLGLVSGPLMGPWVSRCDYLDLVSVLLVIVEVYDSLNL